MSVNNRADSVCLDCLGTARTVYPVFLTPLSFPFIPIIAAELGVIKITRYFMILFEEKNINFEIIIVLLAIMKNNI